MPGAVGAQAARVPVNEYEFPTAKVANVQSQLERLVAKNYYLHQSARDAYRGYLLSYNSHQMKDTFNVHTLDLASVSKSFGFSNPPKVALASWHAGVACGVLTESCRLCLTGPWNCMHAACAIACAHVSHFLAHCLNSPFLL